MPLAPLRALSRRPSAARQRLLMLVVVVGAILIALVGPSLGDGRGEAASGHQAVSASTSTSAQEAAAQRLADRPNIILISTDDQAVADLPWMPILKRELVDQGTAFTRALSPHPLCCPARAAILTGQYAQNNGVKSNQAPYNFQALDINTTLPVWLERAGYTTAFMGKYLNGFGTQGVRQPGWTYWDPTMIGQYAYTPFQMEENGHRRWYRHINNVDYINGKLNALVDRFSRADKPFFIWASQVAPHGRLDLAHGIKSTARAFPPTRFAHDFSTTPSPSLRSPGYHEVDTSDKNALVQSKRRPPPSAVDKVFRSRIRALQAVDQGIGQLVRHLAADGELDNTYILFTSDNGFELGQHHLMTKNVPYSESLRVPMIIRGPGVPAGQLLDDRALMIDLAPTIADLAGATPLVKVDGVSLMPTVLDRAPLRDTVLIQAGPSKRVFSGDRGWWWRGVTTGRYTYADFYANHLEELYDRQVDPAENINLATDPAYAGVLAELRRRTELLGDCAGADQCSRFFPPVPDPDPSRENGVLSRAVDPK